jgi:putative peptide zinc metalloprotease protein
MVTAAPRLRADLAISPQDTGGAPSLVIKDPVSGRFYRLGETERFIAEQLDGENSLEEVRRRAEQRFKAALPEDTLSAFVGMLGSAGLLDGEAPRAPAPSGIRKRIRGSLLYLRLPLFDPDQVLGRMVHRLQFLFTRTGIILAAALIATGLLVTIANAGAIAQDVSRLYQLEAIPLFLVVVLLIGSVHEFGHGITCKRYGGEVHEVGFMLLYFQPAFYCNVSDAWLFPERSKRLWVGAAGPLFELSLWALATIAWRMTEPDTWINYVALAVMTISGIKSLFNLNPFIKLDGYYLISDYLGIPNLRARSFKYVGDLFRRLLGGAKARKQEITRRERRAYLTYGLIAGISSISLLGFIFISAGGYFIDRGQILALALLTWVGISSTRRYRRMFGGGSGKPDPADDEDGSLVSTAAPAPAPAVSQAGALIEATAEATPETTPAPPAPPGRLAAIAGRFSRKARIRLALAMAAALVLFLGQLQLRVGGGFDVLPEGNADIHAAVSGLVEEVMVDEGTLVKAGDVIARLSDRDLRAELLRVDAQVKAIQANVDRLHAGPTPEEVRLARAAVSKTSDALKFAQSTLTRSRDMFKKQVLSAQELQNDEQLATAAANDLTDARARLSVLQRGARREDITATRAQLEGLENQKQFLEQQLELLNIKSPVAGVVATPSRELRALRGQLVARGALVAKVFEVRTVTAQIAVPEKEIADIRVGQPVRLRSRAYPSTVFQGKVTAIATAAQGSSSAVVAAAAVGAPAPANTTRMFLVTTQIDNGSMLLKPGMTGQAKIYCGERRIIGLITRRLARTFKVELWSML